MPSRSRNFPRYLSARLRDALADTPVVLIHDPRQSGKTTLARAVGERRGYRYFSFDNDAARSAARQDPAGFVAGLPEKLYIESYGNFVRMADVFVDSRGDIYLTGGAQQGIYILRYTGPVKN